MKFCFINTVLMVKNQKSMIYEKQLYLKVEVSIKITWSIFQLNLTYSNTKSSFIL